MVDYAIDTIAISLFRFQKSGDYISDPATRRNFVPQVADAGWGHVEATSERGSKRPHGSTIKSFLGEYGHIPLRVVEVRSMTRLHPEIVDGDEIREYPTCCLNAGLKIG